MARQFLFYTHTHTHTQLAAAEQRSDAIHFHFNEMYLEIRMNEHIKSNCERRHNNTSYMQVNSKSNI